MTFYTGLRIDPSIITSKMSEFLEQYERANNESSYPDPDDLIVMQNYGDHNKCVWKRRRADVMVEPNKRFHAENKKSRDILNAFCHVSDDDL